MSSSPEQGVGESKFADAQPFVTICVDSGQEGREFTSLGRVFHTARRRVLSGGTSPKEMCERGLLAWGKSAPEPVLPETLGSCWPGAVPKSRSLREAMRVLTRGREHLRCRQGFQLLALEDPVFVGVERIENPPGDRRAIFRKRSTVDRNVQPNNDRALCGQADQIDALCRLLQISRDRRGFGTFDRIGCSHRPGQAR